MPESKKFYLTTPIYYVNARPHIGTSYTTLVADTIARRKRALGIETWFLTGTDEHGQKIERSAEKAGCSPQEFTDEVSAQFRGLWDRMGLEYDDYIRTTEPRHKRGVQKLFALLKERGYIYKGTYTGQYCVSDEAYVDGPPGIACPDCGRITETVSEENYFFKLSAFERTLLEYYEAHPEFIQPETRRNEVLSFVRSGLKDLSISRTSFNWGIPVPGDEKHVIYVWMDALANYITSLGWESEDAAARARFAKFWPADLHIIGKEISRFHCVYWPAFLMAAGLPLPKSIVAHGWLLFEQNKMSKSRGNIVRAETILDVFGAMKPDLPKAGQDRFGADVLRYFLLREVVFGQDGSFSFDALVQRYNADLANGYGNLVSRTLSMIQKYFDGVVPANDGASAEIGEAAARTLTAFDEHMAGLDFSRALETVWTLVGAVDGYLTAQAPWKQKEGVTDDAQAALRARSLYTAAEAIRVITTLVYPVMPWAAAQVWAQLGLGDIEAAAKRGELKNLAWGGLQPGTKLGVLGPVFPRAEKEAVARMQEMEANNVVKAETEKETERGESTNGAETTPLQPTAGLNGPPASQPLATQKLETPAVSAAGAAAPVAHSSKLRAAMDGLAVALAETTSEASAAAAFETAIAGMVQELVAKKPAAAPTAKPAPELPEGKISIDDFLKVELRVAQVKVAERVPKADKLLRLEVDLGGETRQILAGIAESYEPEQLIGRQIVIVANLAPRKMRGLESNGMLLAASVEGGKAVLAGFHEPIENGAKLK
ncbi:MULTISPECIES: methionine--tRNA ligase [Acidobacterium]|uniref:Methionine--tRNA ligase n=1 Tax=Acidobacterium capsulatum (strain ATCC 51196 / DSM 11244 / BCRC 80197 / JCM 7670 / NBRC 15755 / NCIMB 13165 / 161) TaxID=240015 RepID=C1F3Q3_ACIC5|nr:MULTISPECIES: methionine--tRNA ligase [Acidobacterium]ACO33724.1 methionine--tRNA ligase [Acidobacterium capsulatum ATCC 51196]HCT60569.1 methionine--tRNA ligase [Acidobacterium sp.]